MNVALCDDSLADLERLDAALKGYLVRRDIEAQVLRFSSADTMLEQARETTFDLVLLDILMPALDGIRTVRELRDIQGGVPVVFFSASREYALDAFSVDAAGYVCKPWTEPAFDKAIDHVMEAVRIQRSRYLILPTVEGFTRVNAEHLMYVESDLDNQIRLAFAGGRVICIRHTLATFPSVCEGKVTLVQAGRSLLVNPRQIMALSGNDARFRDGSTVSIPRRGLKAVREAVLAL